METMQQGLEKVAKIRDMGFTGISDADGIRAMCARVNQFFDSVFGDGTAEKLFQGRCSMTKCMEAMECPSTKGQPGKGHAGPVPRTDAQDKGPHQKAGNKLLNGLPATVTVGGKSYAVESSFWL